MATIIDSLVVELGLDPTNFTKGQQKAVDSLRKLQEQAEKTNKDMHKGFGELGDILNGLTSGALKFGAALLGARGIEETFKKITEMNVQVGRSAEIIGTSAEELSKWESIARRAGGSAEEMRETFRTMATAISQINVTGPNTDFFQWLNKLGVNFRQFTDDHGQLKNFTGFFEAISQGMSKLPPGERLLAANALGLGNQNILLFNQGRDAIARMLKDQERIGFATTQQVESSRELVRLWTELQERMENGARILVEKWTPGLINVLKELNAWFDLGNNVGQDPDPHGRLTGGAAFGLYPGSGRRRGAADRPNLEDFIAGPQNQPGPFSPYVTSGIRAKEGANVPLGLYALAQALEDLPTFSRITSGQDAYHRGLPSAHNRGLALDFTLKNPQMAGVIDEALRRKFSELGIDARLINEYDPRQRGPHTTAPHYHIGFANQAALQKFNKAREEGKIDFHIQNLTVKADNPKELATGLAGSGPVNNALRNRTQAPNANSGAN